MQNKGFESLLGKLPDGVSAVVGAALFRTFRLVGQGTEFLFDLVWPVWGPNEALTLQRSIHAKRSQRARPPLVQKIDDRPYLKRNEIFFGLGDIFLGIARVHQEASRTKRVPLVDWSSFSKKHLLELRNHAAVDERFICNRIPIEQINSNLPLILPFKRALFTNRRPQLPLSPETVDFLRMNGGAPSSLVNRRIEEFLLQHNLSSGEFDVAHIRFGDPKTRKQDITELIMRRLESLCGQSNRMLVISDHPSILPNFGNSSHVIVRTHSIDRDGHRYSDEEFLTVLTDFFLMTRAKRIFSFSRYAWGSGFCQVASALSGTPLHSVIRHRVEEL